MTKVTMIETLTIVLRQVARYFVECGLKEQYIVMPQDAELVKYDIVKSGYAWLIKVVAPLVEEVAEVKGLLSQETWDMYQAMGDCDDFQEVVRLKKGLRALRSAISSRARPDFFKKVKINGIIRRNKKAKSKHNQTSTTKHSKRVDVSN